MKIKELKNMNTKQKLLHENGRALQFLHNAKGFDFESPYFLARIPGSFTFNSVNKIIRENIRAEYSAALLIKSNNPTWRKQLVFANITEHGKFDAQHHSELEMWKYHVDSCFNIGHFEEVRKKGTEYFYIIAQAKSLLVKPEKKAADLSERFRMVEDTWNPGYCGDGRGNRYISSIKIRSDFDSGKAFTHKIDRYTNTTDELTSVIDKSGYLVCYRRQDLKHRALQLKYSRQREAATIYDCSEEEKRIRIRIDALKKAISIRVLTADTHEEAENIRKAAESLRWATFYFERHHERRKNNEYSNIEYIKNSFSTIDEYLERAWKE